MTNLSFFLMPLDRRGGVRVFFEIAPHSLFWHTLENKNDQGYKIGWTCVRTYPLPPDLREWTLQIFFIKHRDTNDIKQTYTGHIFTNGNSVSGCKIVWQGRNGPSGRRKMKHG